MPVVRLIDALGPPPWPQPILKAMEAIFWETAGRPPSEAASRTKFMNRWLTSYLKTEPQHAFASIAGSLTNAGGTAKVDGYLVGTMTTPHETERYIDEGYFGAFAPLLGDFPAHLHINLTAQARGHGTGRALIDAFCRHAASQGARGVHVVTGAAARNVAFYYGHVGFTEQGRTHYSGRDLVLLGKRLKD